MGSLVMGRYVCEAGNRYCNTIVLVVIQYDCFIYFMYRE